eukprot:scaffold1122_cov50-Phaeocystis_antarctica.AAC.2
MTSRSSLSASCATLHASTACTPFRARRWQRHSPTLSGGSSRGGSNSPSALVYFSSAGAYCLWSSNSLP